MYRLLGRQTSGNVQKVIFMFEELGTPYTREDYGRQFENTQTAEYKALNPTSKVPTLVDGSTVIWESNTILRYLAVQEALSGYGGMAGAVPSLALMRAVKDQFDPGHRMAPGRFPEVM